MLVVVGVTHGDWLAVCYFQWHIGACPLCVLFTLHSSLFTREALVFVQSFATIATFTANASADYEGRSLSGHSEATGIHTVVLSQLKG